MAAMERLLVGGNVELTAEELAVENEAVKVVQREMNEADEPNFLEEEDMHVFDREPLSDRLPLVSCNTCMKPIKSSHFLAHAEICRSLTASDDTVAELDAGANQKKPPRKARKKLPNAQENSRKRSDFLDCHSGGLVRGTKSSVLTEVSEQNTIKRNPSFEAGPGAGDAVRLLSMKNEDSAVPDSVGTSVGGTDDQAHVATGPTISGGDKRVSTIAEETIGSVRKSGRSYGCSGVEQGSAMSHMRRFSSSDLDVLCGVYLETGARCRQYLTCSVRQTESLLDINQGNLHSESSKRAITGRRRPYEILLEELKGSRNRLRSSKVHDSGLGPSPMATKVYYVRHKHRLRGIIGSMYHDACASEFRLSTSQSSFAPSCTRGNLFFENCGPDIALQPHHHQSNSTPLLPAKDYGTVEPLPLHMMDQRRLANGMDYLRGVNQRYSVDDNYFPGSVQTKGKYGYPRDKSPSRLDGVGISVLRILALLK